MRLQSFWECESLTVRLAFKSYKLGPAIYQCNFEFLHFSAYTFNCAQSQNYFNYNNARKIVSSVTHTLFYPIFSAFCRIFLCMLVEEYKHKECSWMLFNIFQVEFNICCIFCLCPTPKNFCFVFLLLSFDSYASQIKLCWSTHCVSMFSYVSENWFIFPTFLDYRWNTRSRVKLLKNIQ